MIVMKFGGSSIGSAAQISKVSEIISSQLERKPIIVVSALSDVTNTLLASIDQASRGHAPKVADIESRHQIVLSDLDLPEDLLKSEFQEIEALFKGVFLLQECSPKTKDRILAFGEHCSSKIVAAFLNHKFDIPVKSVCSYELGLKTDSQFGHATPKYACFQNIKEVVESDSDKLLVTTGFIAKDASGNITTLGRNGSDYSASLIGAAIGAEEIQIWTDVSGVMTADPRMIPDAKPVTEMSFEEASELAYFGAKVIHPSTIVPAMKKHIPVRILNTNRPEAKGTTIYKNKSRRSGSAVKSIAHRSGLTVINITSARMLAQHGFLFKIFEAFAKQKIVIDMITTSEVSVSLTVDDHADLSEVIGDLRSCAEVSIEKGQSVMSVVGEGVREDTTVTARVFSILNQNDIPVRMISMGASKINLSFILETAKIRGALKALHQSFFSETI